MAKTRQQKEAVVQELIDLFQSAKSAVFSNFSGINVVDVDSLRGKCRAENVRYFVTKKSLLKIATKNSGLDVDPKMFDGEIATVFGIDDEVAPAKILAEFGKKHESIQFVGGFLDRKFISAEQVRNLSKLPSREQLLAKLVGSIQSPISGLVNVLSGNMRGLVQVLTQIKDTKEAKS